MFASAPHRALPDPLDRLLGYVDLRKSILRGELPEFTCLVGTMVQEVYQTWTAESLALHTQTVIQGAFIPAKARQGPAVAVGSLDHLRRYLELPFTRPTDEETRS
ncbi:MAG TPA: hypothetical protein VK698_00050 [Kofleriaceae bacterium]|nr:hypothetical protein [Kofleriaceae bacterium]